MILTKESRINIKDAWQYNSAGSGSAAMTELDKYADALMNSESIEVEDEITVLRSFADFIIWKNKDWVLGQIPILTNKEVIYLIPFINKLILDTKANKIKFIETNSINRMFRLNVITDEGHFNIDLGNVINFENLPCYTFGVDDLKLYFIADQQYELKYITSEFNKK